MELPLELSERRPHTLWIQQIPINNCTSISSTSHINKLFFAPTRVEANHILQILRLKYSREDTLGKEWMKNQERFIDEVFKQMIEDRRDDQDFLSDLLHFITGLVMCQIPTPDLTTVFLLSLMIIWCSYY